MELPEDIKRKQNKEGCCKKGNFETLGLRVRYNRAADCARVEVYFVNPPPREIRQFLMAESGRGQDYDQEIDGGSTFQDVDLGERGTEDETSGLIPVYYQYYKYQEAKIESVHDSRDEEESVHDRDDSGDEEEEGTAEQEDMLEHAGGLVNPHFALPQIIVKSPDPTRDAPPRRWFGALRDQMRGFFNSIGENHKALYMRRVTKRIKLACFALSLVSIFFIAMGTTGYYWYIKRPQTNNTVIGNYRTITLKTTTVKTVFTTTMLDPTDPTSITNVDTIAISEDTETIHLDPAISSSTPESVVTIGSDMTSMTDPPPAHQREEDVCGVGKETKGELVGVSDLVGGVESTTLSPLVRLFLELTRKSG